MIDNRMECHKLGLAITAYYCPRKVVEEQSAVVTANHPSTAGKVAETSSEMDSILVVRAYILGIALATYTSAFHDTPTVRKC